MPRKKKKILKEKNISKKKIKRIYRVILVGNNQQKKNYGTFKTEKEAYAVFNKILENNNNVSIPVEYNTKTIVKKMKYELLIIKSKTSIDVDDNRFRDDYGEFVVYETNSPEWIVHDKAKYLKEEKFWVFGDNGKKNRKDCYWIYDEFIKKYACSVDNFLNIYIYYNKLLFDCTEKLNMVICKNKSDCIRLYNYLENRFHDDKTLKHALFSGSVTNSKKRKDMCIEKIRKLTNWNNDKIFRSTTRRNKNDYKPYDSNKKTKQK